jgi:hypothetical protein
MSTHKYLLGAAVLLFTDFASAGFVTAYEEIVDPSPFELFARDLSRTRATSEGFFEFETSNALIESENALDANFGLLNLETVNYQHDLSWLFPAPDTYIAATLTISAWGSIGNNDEVYLDNIIFAGTLPTGFGSGTVGFSEFSLSSSNGSVLDVVLGDGTLDVEVDKNVGAASWFLDPQGKGFNAISIYSSKLEVSYMAAVPEPSNVMLGLTLFFCAGLVSRRQRLRKTRNS